MEVNSFPYELVFHQFVDGVKYVRENMGWNDLMVLLLMIFVLMILPAMATSGSCSFGFIFAWLPLILFWIASYLDDPETRINFVRAVIAILSTAIIYGMFLQFTGKCK